MVGPVIPLVIAVERHGVTHNQLAHLSASDVRLGFRELGACGCGRQDPIHHRHVRDDQEQGADCAEIHQPTHPRRAGAGRGDKGAIGGANGQGDAAVTTATKAIRPADHNPRDATLFAARNRRLPASSWPRWSLARDFQTVLTSLARAIYLVAAQSERGTMKWGYVHGYDSRENARLQDQAGTLVELLHSDTSYPGGSSVLEAGCGVGAQTLTLARNSPDARITSVDISEASLAEAKRRADAAGLTNVQFRQADMFALPFDSASFDHVFVCFVLEHLARPVEALDALRELLRPGGTITVIEGDHGSAYFHPDSEAAHAAIQCQVELQRAAGGSAMIGRELYPLLTKAGFKAVHVSPRMVYADFSTPELVDGFTRKTFTAMIAGVRESAIGAGLVEPAVFDRGIRDLYRTAEPDGVFCYTFFKAVGKRD
jgi:ubiquinone/menaquinone biosynthesis C-methylase UbiE